MLAFLEALPQPLTSPQRLQTRSWPHGWVNSSNVTAFSIDVTVVTISNLKKIIAATLEHLGGREGDVSDYAPDYVQATMDTNLGGGLIIVLTPTPSKAEAFKALGCRIYFRGIKKAQQDLPEVKNMDVGNGAHRVTMICHWDRRRIRGGSA